MISSSDDGYEEDSYMDSYCFSTNVSKENNPAKNGLVEPNNNTKANNMNYVTQKEIEHVDVERIELEKNTVVEESLAINHSLYSQEYDFVTVDTFEEDITLYEVAVETNDNNSIQWVPAPEIPIEVVNNDIDDTQELSIPETLPNPLPCSGNGIIEIESSIFESILSQSGLESDIFSKEKAQIDYLNARPVVESEYLSHSNVEIALDIVPTEECTFSNEMVINRQMFHSNILFKNYECPSHSPTKPSNRPSFVGSRIFGTQKIPSFLRIERNNLSQLN